MHRLAHFSASLWATILMCGYTAPTLAGDGLMVASGGTWGSYKDIRQRKTTAEELAKGTAAPSPLPAPASPAAIHPGTAPAQTANTAAPIPGAAAPPPAPPPHPRAAAKPDPSLITAPIQPNEQGGNWKFYIGSMNVAADPYYDPHGINYQWAYSIKDPLPVNPRVLVHMHGSGGGVGSIIWAFAPEFGDIEVRAQDAEAYNADWREWWTFGRDGMPYPGRRIAAALDYLTTRYHLDLNTRGIVLEGPSMGGAGAVIQTMILPSPWREKIAYSSARAGVIMPRLIAQRDPAQYANLPPDNAANKALWDGIDFAVQAASDPIVRNMHYRHAFSSDDQFSAGVNLANTQLQFVNLVERYKISGAFGWVKVGHDSYEGGVGIPDMSVFEAPEQDVSLDRALPAITQSTGNWPLNAIDRANAAVYPRGHYNMGITWNHAGIIDTPDQVVFPLKYVRRVNIGGNVPDQPPIITISVTPRRAQHFKIRDGDTLKWSWDAGALSGVAKVTGDTVTIDGIPLVSGEPYKMLTIYR